MSVIVTCLYICGYTQKRRRRRKNPKTKKKVKLLYAGALRDFFSRSLLPKKTLSIFFSFPWMDIHKRAYTCVYTHTRMCVYICLYVQTSAQFIVVQRTPESFKFIQSRFLMYMLLMLCIIYAAASADASAYIQKGNKLLHARFCDSRLKQNLICINTKTKFLAGIFQHSFLVCVQFFSLYSLWSVCWGFKNFFVYAVYARMSHTHVEKTRSYNRSFIYNSSQLT